MSPSIGPPFRLRAERPIASHHASEGQRSQAGMIPQDAASAAPHVRLSGLLGPRFMRVWTFAGLPEADPSTPTVLASPAYRRALRGERRDRRAGWRSTNVGRV